MPDIKRIKHAFVDCEINQTELAERLGVKPQQICDVIHGRVKTPYIREGLCRVLDLDPSIWDGTADKHND